jgi:hypothetical protein
MLTNSLSLNYPLPSITQIIKNYPDPINSPSLHDPIPHPTPYISHKIISITLSNSLNDPSPIKHLLYKDLNTFPLTHLKNSSLNPIFIPNPSFLYLSPRSYIY